MCRHIWGVRVRRGAGGAPQEGGRSHCQVFDEAESYGLVAVCRGQEVGMPVPGYSPAVFAPPVGGGWQGLLQGARTWLRAPGVAVGAVGRHGVRYDVYDEGSDCVLYVVGDDGAEVCQPSCAAFTRVYSKRVL